MLDGSIMEHKGLRLSAVLSIELPELGLSGTTGTTSRLLEESRLVIGLILAEHGGELVKSIGDSSLAVFSTCKQAVDAALAMAEALPALATKLSTEGRLLTPRMGIHVGDVAYYEKNIFGPTVDSAEALRSAIQPGKLCISGEVLSFLKDSTALEVEPLPEEDLRGLPQGIKAYTLAKSIPEGSVNPQQERVASLDEIRRAILDEIKKQGRRLSVDEARSQFGWYGLEAMEVIASLADAGILVGKRTPSRVSGTGAYTDRRDYNETQGNFGTEGSQSSQGISSSALAGEIGKSIESAVHLIVKEIEKAVETKAKQPARRPRDKKNSKAVAPNGAIERYRKEITTKADKQRKGLAGNLIAFLVINAGLWFLNINVARGFAWAPIVSTFWGFGLLENIFSAWRLGKQARETEALPDLDDEKTKELKEIHKAKSSVSSHFFSTLSISAGLTVINMATESSDPWHLIPIGVLSLIYVIHLFSYLTVWPAKARWFFASLGVRRNKKSLEEARARRQSTTTDLGGYADLYRGAEESVAEIEAGLVDYDAQFREDMKPQLKDYLGQVLLLAKTANELDSIIGQIPVEALQKDKATLTAKLEKASPGMRTEYQESIKEVQTQEESFKALAEQRELIDLRLRSSVNQLQQLKLELAKAKAADVGMDALLPQSLLSSVKTRSQELSNYIDDLKKGHLEALVDPFEELERRFKDQPLVQGNNEVTEEKLLK